MGKYKAAKTNKTPAPPQLRPGAPCLVLIVVAMVVICLVMFWAMKSQ